MSKSLYISNSQRQTQSHALKKRVLRFVTFITIFISISLLVLGNTQAKSNSGADPHIQKITDPSSSVATKTAVDAGGSQQKARVTTTVSKPVPKCVPLTSYAQPAAPSSTSVSSGLNQLPTQIVNYTVYGNTKDQISIQLHTCSPVSHAGVRYAASTDYSINWSFKYQSDEAGICKVSSAYVGLHIIKVMPRWQPTSTNAQLSNSWKAFYANLDHHENGHANLDRQYAERILSELQNLSPTTCDTINANANARANALIAELNRANDHYDATTSHGSTEGANL